MEVQFVELARYPHGKTGDLLVCFVHRLEARWGIVLAPTREDADVTFKEIAKRDDLLRVPLTDGPNKGRRSSVMWIARCDYACIWTRIKETEGVREHYG